MPIIRIPAPLRRLTNDEEEIPVTGTTVGEAITRLDETHPGLGERILDEHGTIHRFVNVFLNDEDVRFLQENSTPVTESDVISIVPAIAGG